MRRVEGQTVSTAPHGAVLVELLSRDLMMAWVAEVARVAVVIAAAQRERFDVIDDSRKSGEASLFASLAQSIGASEATLSLLLSGSTPQPFNALAWLSPQRGRTARHQIAWSR